MAQAFQEKNMKGEEGHPIHDDPQHDVKEQIESGVGTISSQPLFEGASEGEKLPETRVGETLLTDNLQKLDATASGSMDTDDTNTEEERVVKDDVAETFTNQHKEDADPSGEKKEDDYDSLKSASSGDDSQGIQEQQGTKFYKVTSAGIPRGKPHFRISASHGNRSLGDNSLQSGGLGGALSGNGLRGNSRGGLARTGSGLARTGSGIPQGSNDLKDFSAALESESKSSESSLPSTDAKLRSDEKQSDSTMFEKAAETKDAALGKLSAAQEGTAEQLSSAKYNIVEKATIAKEAIVEKAGGLKGGVVATLKDQLLPVKDSTVDTSKMDVDESNNPK